MGGDVVPTSAGRRPLSQGVGLALPIWGSWYDRNRIDRRRSLSTSRRQDRQSDRITRRQPAAAQSRTKSPHRQCHLSVRALVLPKRAGHRMLWSITTAVEAVRSFSIEIAARVSGLQEGMDHRCPPPESGGGPCVARRSPAGWRPPSVIRPSAEDDSHSHRQTGQF